MTGAVGIGINTGDNPFGAEGGLHQHLRQTLELTPLLLCRIVIKRHLRVRLIDQVAALIADNHKAARCRAVERLRRTGGFAHHKRRCRRGDQVIQRFGAYRAQQDIDAVQSSRFGAFDQ